MKWTQCIFFTALFLNILLAWQLFFSDYGMQYYLNLRHVFAEHQQKIETLKDNNSKTSAQIRWIRSDSNYQEYMVRKERHYAKPSEQVYLFTKEWSME